MNSAKCLRFSSILATGVVLLLNTAGGALAQGKPAKQAPGDLECLVLTQKSEFGPILMEIAPSAMRMDIEKMGINWVARAPQWQSYMYSDETKSIITRDYEVWRNNLIQMPGMKKHEKETFTLKPTGSKEKISGYNCRKVAIFRESGSKKSPKQLRPGEPKKPYPMGYVWISDDFPAPRQVTEVMRQLTQVDVNRGMVLKATVLKAGSFKDYKNAFETLSVKKEKLASSLFEPPKGYKHVESEIDLMMGSDEPELPSSVKRTIHELPPATGRKAPGQIR